MQRCPGCAAECGPADRFCGDCGAPLPALEIQSVERCAMGPGLAALSDVGLVHWGNEDAFVVSGPPDGVANQRYRASREVVPH